jgi:hypothetical protein
MNDSERLHAVKIVVDDAVEYGCGFLVKYLAGQISHEEFVRQTRIKYRDALNELNIILNPLPEPEQDPEGAIVRRKLI